MFVIHWMKLAIYMYKRHT